MNKEIIEQIEKEKIVVIVRGVETQKLIPLAEAIYEGGIRFLEITYSANGSVSDEETAQNIQALTTHFKGKMHIGAGTVLNEKQVELTHQAGGEFIISPDTNTEVIKKTKLLGMISMPGALTPTEAQTAHRNGADFVKLFPVTNLGVDYIKAIKAPLSHMKLLAVGGINLNNIKEYLSAGVCGFGIGTNIIDKDMLKNNDFEGIAKLAKKYVEAIV
ncbi:MAG: bifunctional 4-hydroxy-2-oxoglutarate aldolase/2-dehydro-3-deoxy-phosphogluconate aldolase [Ruminococcaceae bacterium]|nr:bifunctional 4-hydroxy-2-oxoglutarate aldolase/2-dehydro-3-deoxy-phosphogluconate aldolase [Oscillospiraceae bacterium]